MARLLALLLSAVTCVAAVAGEDVLISERHKLSKRFIDAQGNYNISFYHINDVHAHLDQFTATGGNCTEPEKMECFGGYARIRTFVNESRPLHQDSLFLNVGDEFQGTLFFSYFGGGYKIAETLNVMGFDAMTLGNHEFDSGSSHLGEFVNNLTFPVISANIESTEPRLNKTIKPYHIFEQYELAVIGVTTETTPDISSPGNETKFYDSVTAVQRTVDHIRATTNIKRIAAITHIGYEEDQRLARETTGLYLIMGGHSHTLLGSMAGSEGAYPTIVRNKEGEEVFIVTAHRWGEHIGYIDVAYDPEGRILAYHGAPVRMTNATKQEPVLQAMVDEWRREFDDEAGKTLGYADVILDHTACKIGQCVLGNVITDAMYEYRVKSSGPGAKIPDFALMNGGGVRATIDVGNITRGEIIASFPFGNEMVEFDLTGQEIWDIFDGVLKRVNKYEPAKKVSSFVQVSSQIQVRWVPTNVTANPSIGNLTSISIGGKPIELDKTYRLLTIDFIAKGGDNIVLPGHLGLPSLNALTLALEYYVQKYNPLTAALDGRLTYELPHKCKKRRRGVKKTVNPL